MKITSIKLANILSFGPKQEFEQLSEFNLFIGKNGSGKSNMLKLIGDLKIRLHKISAKSKNFTILLDGDYKKRNSSLANQASFLELKYEVLKGIESIDGNRNKQIILKEAKHNTILGSVIELKNGDIQSFKDNIIYLNQNTSDNIFFKELIELGKKSINLTLLNEGMCYIFNRKIGFLANAYFLEINYSKPFTNYPELDYAKLPSGFIHCAKILTQMILKSKPQHGILLIDEPELHFEPRVCRRFISFLFYLHIKSNHTKREQGEKSEKENIYYEIKNAINEIHKGIPDDYNEKLFPKSIAKEDEWTFNQIFIASHSATVLNAFLQMNKWASIYEFNSSNIEIGKTNKQEAISDNLNGLFSTIRKINLNVHSILDNLGCTGADLLQTNGMIWVEGPSDIIYIRKWLEMYTKENHKKEFIQGMHYEFKMTAGTLLNNLCFAKDGENEYEKLVAMFSFSRNNFVVIDSDAFKKDGKLSDKSNFRKAKQYIKEEFEKKIAEGYNLGLWYKEGNLDIKTIEDYLDDESKALLKKTRKMASAIDITKKWAKEEARLSRFKDGLENEIKMLYNIIVLWNK